MEFRIADTFTDSLARLTGDEQKAVKTAAFDLQVNPAHPGLQFHKLDRPKDPNFASIRVSKDIRIIVHRTAASLLLCYVDHHDEAYRWAERRRIETHPRTGAAQLVEVRETVKEITVPKYVEAGAPPAPAAPSPSPVRVPLFAQVSDDTLLAYGVPAEWLDDVRQATEDSLLALADHLPAEAAEALLELATGGTPQKAPPPAKDADPFAHPDAQRRFRVMHNVEELERALDYPWEKWTVFLHPAQEQLVRTEFNGPARVAGSAGTGKTIVALHRAVWLARRHPEARVLLTTFSDSLAFALRARLRRLLGNEPRLAERIDVDALDAVAVRLYRAQGGREPSLAGSDVVRSALQAASEAVGGHRFKLPFLLSEWAEVVDAWQLADWPAYRDVARLGRKTRLPEAQRKVLWSIFEKVRAALATDGRLTRAGLFTSLAEALAKARAPYDFAVVDEAQDLSVAQLRFLAALGSKRPDSLFFAGDLGQRIFQQPFSWKSLGVDIRGRSRTLKVNYRTSHQIRGQADRLLGPTVSDVDGNSEDRRHTVSVFNGPAPVVDVAADADREGKVVSDWLAARSGEGLLPHEIGVFVRSEAELERAVRAVKQAALAPRLLDEHVETASGQVSVATMHLAKGLEFRAVAVMACDDEVIPSQQRIEAVGDDADLQEVYDTERHLLYVACTRARDHLLVTGVVPASEFLDDLKRPGE
jgi:superfamily I DNA/RNA helicase